MHRVVADNVLTKVDGRDVMIAAASSSPEMCQAVEPDDIRADFC